MNESPNRTQKPHRTADRRTDPARPAGLPKRRRFKLTTARGVRRELAGLYGEFRNGDIPAESARTAAFILRCLLESLRIDEIESRLKTLEEHANVQPAAKNHEA